MNRKNLGALLLCVLALFGCNRESSSGIEWTAEEAVTIAERLQREAADSQYQEAMTYYLSEDYGEAQKRFAHLAGAGNSMAAFYVWKCNPLGHETAQLRETSEQVIFMAWPRKDPSSGYEYTSVATFPFLLQAAKLDNPYAMSFLNENSTDEKKDRQARAVSYWRIRAREANDGDAWYCLALVDTSDSEEGRYRLREYFFKGTLAGSEAATYAFIHNKEELEILRTEKRYEQLRKDYPHWEEQYFTALKKLADEGHPFAQFRYSELKDDESYLELAANQNLYNAWWTLATYYAVG